MATPPPAEPRKNLLPDGVVVVLVLVAALGVLLTLAITRATFAGGDADSAPSYGPAFAARLVDRAEYWVDAGPGGPAGLACVAVVAALAGVVWYRRREGQPVAEGLRLAAFSVAALVGLVELAGVLVLAAGYASLATDPTNGRDLGSELLFVGPRFVLCLAGAVLSALVAWLLWNARLVAAVRPGPEVDAVRGQADVPEGLFRRPGA